MSVRCMARVWENSAHKGSNLLLLLAVADYAHDDGTNAFPRIETLATKTRLSERSVTRLLGKLVKSGELRIEQRPGRSNVMTVLVRGDNLSLPEEEAPSDALDVTRVETPVSPSRDIVVSPSRDIAVSPITIKEPSVTVIEPSTSEDAAQARPFGTTQEGDAPTLSSPSSRGTTASAVTVWARDPRKLRVAEHLVAAIEGPYRGERACLLPQIDQLLGRGWDEGSIKNTLGVAAAAGRDARAFVDFFHELNGTNARVEVAL